jgi:hypothetical protein
LGVPERNQRTIDRIRNILERGADAGVFRRAIDPLDLHLTINGLAFHNVSNRHTLNVIFGRDLFDPKVLAERRKTIVEIVLKFVQI